MHPSDSCAYLVRVLDGFQRKRRKVALFDGGDHALHARGHLWVCGCGCEYWDSGSDGFDVGVDMMV